MSYREDLLAKSEPLEKHERIDLEKWRAVLKDDMDVFGPTDEDVARVRKISARLALK